MLEELTEILNKPIRMFPSREDAERIIKQERKEQEGQILNLFKSEVDKLTLATEESISENIQQKTKKWSIVNPAFIEDISDIAIKTQLQHTKKQLLDIMEK